MRRDTLSSQGSSVSEASRSLPVLPEPTSNPPREPLRSPSPTAPRRTPNPFVQASRLMLMEDSQDETSSESDGRRPMTRRGAEAFLRYLLTSTFDANAVWTRSRMPPDGSAQLQAVLVVTLSCAHGRLLPSVSSRDLSTEGRSISLSIRQALLANPLFATISSEMFPTSSFSLRLVAWIFRTSSRHHPESWSSIVREVPLSQTSRGALSRRLRTATSSAPSMPGSSRVSALPPS